MEEKKKIVHLIDDLCRGGAETMLVALLPDLTAVYDIVLVTLRPEVEFEQKELSGVRHISLNYRGLADMPRAVRQLRKIIIQEAPYLVRAQLYWTTIIARLACPKNIPFVFSVHATLNEDPIAAHKKYFLYWLEKATYRSSQTMIGVTQAVVDSFVKVHPRHGKTYLLHNFVRPAFFQQHYSQTFKPGKTLRLVSVSSLRLIKNIPYLVEAMKLLKDQDVLLDIYGNGPMYAEIEALIARHNLHKVQLKGKVTEVHKVLPQYHAYVSASTVEGFGIAVAEALGIGLPVIAADIPVYREVCSAHAVYLNNKEPQSLAAIVMDMLSGRMDLGAMSDANKVYAQRFTKQQYVEKLQAIYRSVQ